MAKKLGLLLALVLLAGVLFACARSGNIAPVKTTTPEEAKTAVADYLQVRYAGAAKAPEQLYDITPKGVFGSTGFQLFSDANESGATGFLIYNGMVASEIIGFGGFGLASLETANFDGRGNQVVYTYSWGSGLHRSILEVCDGDCGAFSVFTDHSGKNLMVQKEKKNVFGVYEAIYDGDVQTPKRGEKMGTLRGETDKSGAYKLVYTTQSGEVHEVVVGEKTGK